MNARIAVLLLSILMLGSCDNATSPPPPPPPPAPVASVQLNHDSVFLERDVTLQLEATARDSAGNVLNRTFSWTSSNASIASVSQSGLVTTHAGGLARVVAGVEGKSDTTFVRVPGAAASVELDHDSVFLQRDVTLQLEATTRDSAGNVLNRTLSWTSSNASIASVSQSGLVTTHAGGLARVVAVVDRTSDTAFVRVAGAVASVKLELDTLRALEGVAHQFTATARDAEGYVITGRAVIWSSSDPEIAHVGGLGLVTALRPGTAEVRARVDGDTGRAVVIVRGEHNFDLAFGGWSGTAGEWPRLYMVDPNDPDRQANQLSATLGAGDFAVSPDGQRYVVAGIIGNVRGLYRVNRDGSNPALLLADSAASQPTWSPDGAKIAFRRWPVGEGADIWIMNANGTGLVNLTSDHGATSQHTPAFSPLQGGSYRLAYAHSPGPTAHIWTMNPDGSDKRQVTGGDVWDEAPAWSPDGTKLVFERLGDIWVVQASGGAPWSLISLPLAQFAPQWSPNGALVAFAMKDASGHFEIFTIRMTPGGTNAGGLTQRTADTLDKQEPVWVRRN